MKHARRYACLVALVLLAGCIPQPAPPPPPPLLGPDLVATDIAWPTPLVVGARVPFSITVQNIGDTATPANTILDVLVTVDGVDVGWSDNLAAPLGPGASRAQTVNGGPDGSDGLWSVTAGAHNVTALVNSGSLPARSPISESNSSNNQLVKPFSVEPPTTIALISDRTGNPEVWTMNGDGSNQTQLTNSPDLEATPEVSLDGTKIVFTCRSPEPGVFPNPRIWVMNVDGSDQHQVFVPICVSPPGFPDVCEGVSRDTYPSWSPDGTRIAFVREGNLLGSGIWVMNADGSDADSLRRLGEPRFQLSGLVTRRQPDRIHLRLRLLLGAHPLRGGGRQHGDADPCAHRSGERRRLPHLRRRPVLVSQRCSDRVPWSAGLQRADWYLDRHCRRRTSIGGATQRRRRQSIVLARRTPHRVPARWARFGR